MIAVCVIGVIGGMISHCRRQRRRSKRESRRTNDFRQANPCISSLQTTLPLVLFIAFVLIGPVSSSIFAAWTCETFALDSIANPPTTIAFLVADLSLSSSAGTELCCLHMRLHMRLTGVCILMAAACNSSDETYMRVKSLAHIFVTLWPVGIPLVFLAVLLQCRVPILQGRSNRTVQATGFLHREYDAYFFWWEVVSLMQRMFIIGFVQWIPHTQLFIRTLVGWIVSFMYLVLLFIVQPHKRKDVRDVAIAVQACTVLIFCMVQCIQLFTSLDAADAELATRIMGFHSIDSLVAIMIMIVLTCFALFMLFTVYTAILGNQMQVLRLSHFNELPELGLGEEMEYHLFLSHSEP